MRKLIAKILPMSLKRYIKRTLWSFDNFIRKICKRRPVLRYLEFHVADHCNLNCKSCSHFSNLVKTPAFADFEQYKRDIARLSELFENIKTIRLLGGEPLLNKELPKIIHETRNAFPKAQIYLATNGLLYKEIMGALESAIKSCGVLVRVSLYEPMAGYKDEMVKFFTDREIKYRISPPVSSFLKFINPDGTSKPRTALRHCKVMAQCTFLNNGHISRCGLPYYVKYFNQHFNMSLSMEQDLIDIHDRRLDGFMLNRKLSKPMNACRYCGKNELVDWEQSKMSDASDIKMEDFCVKR